jgi:predicted ATP-grasp superfamily ATP-dependent carboligase
MSAHPALIVPCDDGVVWQLHELHARYTDLQPLIEASLGAKSAYPQIRSRGAFLQAAVDLDIRVPLTQTVSSAQDFENWCVTRPAVLKLDGTWGGSGVAIAHSQAEARAALSKLSRSMDAGTAWKRWLINRDPLALWSWQRRETPRVTIQEFIQGRPANTMIGCYKGKVLAIVTVEVQTAQGPTGAATVVRLVENNEIERAARLLAAHFELNGFHGLDFVIEETTGAAYLIELNPRCTQLGHLQLAGQGDLAGAVTAMLKNEPVAVPEPEDCIQSETVAFFPQALNWNPKSPYLRRGYHDVPWEEPALVRQLLRSSWPERQWLSRVYHTFRASKQPDEVSF